MDIAVWSLIKRLKVQHLSPDIAMSDQDQDKTTSSVASAEESRLAECIPVVVIHPYHTEDDDSGMASDEDDVIDVAGQRVVGRQLLTVSNGSGPSVADVRISASAAASATMSHSNLINLDTTVDSETVDEVYRRNFSSATSSSTSCAPSADVAVGWCQFCLMQLFVSESSLTGCHGNGAESKTTLNALIEHLHRHCARCAETERAKTDQRAVIGRYDTTLRPSSSSSRLLPYTLTSGGYCSNRNDSTTSGFCLPEIANSRAKRHPADVLRCEVGVDDEIREIFSEEDCVVEVEQLAGNTNRWNCTNDVALTFSRQYDDTEAYNSRLSTRRLRHQQEDINGNIVIKTSTAVSQVHQPRPSLDLYKMRKLRIRRSSHRSFGRSKIPSSSASLPSLSLRARPLPVTMSSSAVQHYLSKCLQRTATTDGAPAYCFRSLADSVRHR